VSLDSSIVHPLSPPRTVDISTIEKELESLWRGAGHEDDSVTRATAFNLIYVVYKDETEESPSNLLADLTLSHPSRTILVLLKRTLARTGQSAWVTAYCHRPLPDAQQICSEFITLESGGGENIAIASTIRALLLGDLPTTLIWHHSLTLAHPLLTLLANSLDRIITCDVQEASPASELKKLFEFRRRIPNQVAVADLLWSRLFPWRNAIAMLFDTEEAPARDITSVTLKFKGTKIPSGALLTAAWVTTSLGWNHPHIMLKGKVPVLSFSNSRTLHFEGTNVPARPGEDIGAMIGVEFLLSSGRQLQIRREPEQLIIQYDQIKQQTVSYPDPLLSVLGRELAIWSSHPRREETLRAAYEWQKEILFS
jgi:glucose-6-phosphate dehydrogenase assembly protein OpcA